MFKPMNVGALANEPSDDDITVSQWLRLTTAPPPPSSCNDVAASAGAADESRASTTRVDGVVRRIDEHNVWLGREGGPRGTTEVGVRHGLPASMRLGSLVGRTVRIAVVCEETDDDTTECRTLTVSGEDGRVWLIARSGTVRGVVHALGGGAVLHAALSQRANGPLVIGTSELQWLVVQGEPATLPIPSGGAFRVLLVERRPDDTASYVLADESLFSAPAS